MTQTPLWGRGASRLAQRFSLLVFVLTLGFPSAASALLVDRGPDLVYDTVLDITWVRDARLCVTLNDCINDLFGEGRMTWANANTWASNLVYAGFDDWRLPFASVSAGAGPTTSIHFCTGAGGADEVACRDNEMGYMFYYNLDGNPSDSRIGDRIAVGGEMNSNRSERRDSTRDSQLAFSKAASRGLIQAPCRRAV